MSTEMLQLLNEEKHELEIKLRKVSYKIQNVNRYVKNPGNKSSILNALKTERDSLTQQLGSIKHKIRTYYSTNNN